MDAPALRMVAALAALLALEAPASSQVPGALPGMTHSGKARVYRHGMPVEGSNLRIYGDKVTIDSGIPITFDLSEVDRIDVRHGRVGLGALACGGSCGALMLLTVLGTTEEDLEKNDTTRGELAAGGILWTGISAGIGAGLGYVLSDWKVIYYRQALLDPQERAVALRLDADPHRQTCNLRLVRRF